jgi:citrate lyase subunit beta/citryl-CoA lyase
MSIQRPIRSRRVQLAVPGSSEKMLAKAASLNVDHVFLDLEDAVAPSEKKSARDKIATSLNTLDWSKKTRCVRINDLSTEWAHDDIIRVVELAGRNIDTIMLPKARCASDVMFVDILLSQLEKKLKLERTIGIEVLIEEAEGLLNVEDIARSSPRVESLIFGMGDYSASQGIDPIVLSGKSDYPGDPWHFGRWKIVMTARALGIDAIDGPFPVIMDLETYRTECKRGLLLGFVGKWALHPDQVTVANEVFTPDPTAVAKAREIAAAYAQAESEGRGAIMLDGQMVDVAVVRMLRVILDRAERAGI